MIIFFQEIARISEKLSLISFMSLLTRLQQDQRLRLALSCFILCSPLFSLLIDLL
ncbi:hypothetical protein HPG27_927 [Helicobacter pylori G27]|uniref:Uncharacterized protein n=2 Tax=Helicobacter pylori TaxID=210 RepID=B5Z7Y2_HELPG|nr:hypothetical protein [Helicobacter pylori]ACI27681.1 hypothetical protein HPG27_927 [Helicobacter pylori G27]EJB67341.1 hypothetical protein HPHPH45_1068 [Helicobacter pylori Hp H-45]WRD05134.1 hypothetical protein E5K72_04990 [Helicobacter pylori]WRF55925.1 hypothetical protein FOG19_04755 [Helicobacter pylori]WRF64497.1 hypothetical protein FNE47_04725 [Helicobacter pylori]